jgi:hypothetical protein
MHALQVKSLSNLGWFLSIGTFGQLFAGVVVIYKLLAAPWEDAVTEVVHTDEASTSLVAVMNIIFACAAAPHASLRTTACCMLDLGCPPAVASACADLPG